MSRNTGAMGSMAHLCRAARFVAVSSTRISVDCGRAFALEAIMTSYRMRILTRLDAKYPGSAKSSGRPRSITNMVISVRPVDGRPSTHRC